MAGCKSSDTCLIHICSRTNGPLIWVHACLGSRGICVSETEWEREREQPCLTTPTTDQSELGGGEKNELISLSSGGISPNLSPSQEALVNELKQSILSLPSLPSPPVLSCSTGDSADLTNYFWAHPFTFTFVFPITHIHIQLKKKRRWEKCTHLHHE